MPGPLDEIALFAVRRHDEQRRKREAWKAKVHEQRLAEVRSILHRLNGRCCRERQFRWPEKRDLDRLHVLVLQLARRIRKRAPLPVWKAYKAVDGYWSLRLWQTLSELVDRAVKNAPRRPIEEYNDRLTDERLSGAARKFFERYNEALQGRDPSEVQWEQFDELFSSVTGKTISRRIPLSEAKSATHLEFLKLFCADQQWARKHWRSARTLAVWVATTLQHPELIRKLKRFLIPADIGELMISDVADIPRRLLEEKKDAERARDRKRKCRAAV